MHKLKPSCTRYVRYASNVNVECVVYSRVAEGGMFAFVTSKTRKRQWIIVGCDKWNDIATFPRKVIGAWCVSCKSLFESVMLHKFRLCLWSDSVRLF